MAEVFFWHVPWRLCSSSTTKQKFKPISPKSELQIWKQLIFTYIVLKIISAWTILKRIFKIGRFPLDSTHTFFPCSSWRCTSWYWTLDVLSQFIEKSFCYVSWNRLNLVLGNRWCLLLWGESELGPSGTEEACIKYSGTN